MKPAILLPALLFLLSACIVPPSMFERASWGQPPESWQEQGRYRQATPPGPQPTPELVAGPMPDRTGLASDPTRAAMTQAAPAPDAGAPAPSGTSAAPPRASEPPLYAWDGGVVDGAPQGRVTEEQGEPRGLEPAGRMHIIELYQQVLDERDALAAEVERLRAALEQTTLSLEAEVKKSGELETRVAALEEAQRGLLSDNQAMAARLVTAQIRRLESEKLLLETRIDVEREKAQAAQAALERKTGGKARAPESPRDGGAKEGEHP